MQINETECNGFTCPVLSRTLKEDSKKGCFNILQPEGFWFCKKPDDMKRAVFAPRMPFNV
jgi:hypothetical protein